MSFISEKSLRELLPPKYSHNMIYIYETLDSTNNRAKELISQSTLHGTIVIAQQQTAGKGRLGRSFFSPPNGLYMSIVVKPDFDTNLLTLVTTAAAAATAESIEKVCGKKTGIKWVNDIYINEKKVCGILTEGIADAHTGRIENLIIGIGINTSLEGFPEDLLVTAGAVEGEYSKEELAAEVIRSVLDYIERIETKDFMQSYKNRSILTGKTVNVYKGAYKINPDDELASRPAKVLGIDDNGGLTVIYTDGRRETLSTGEVTIRL